MYTIEQLQKEYLRTIPSNIKAHILQWIKSDTAQAYIGKALKSNLSDKDVNTLYKVGKQKGGEMPYLYWLCCIYIHPLTTGAEIAKRLNVTL